MLHIKLAFVSMLHLRFTFHESFWLAVFCEYIYCAMNIQSITTVKYLECFLVTGKWLLFFAFASVSDCGFWIHVVIHIIKERELTGFDYSAKTIMVLWHLQSHSVIPPENVHVNNRILALWEEWIFTLVLNRYSLHACPEFLCPSLSNHSKSYGDGEYFALLLLYLNTVFISELCENMLFDRSLVLVHLSYMFQNRFHGETH